MGTTLFLSNNPAPNFGTVLNLNNAPVYNSGFSISRNTITIINPGFYFMTVASTFQKGSLGAYVNFNAFLNGSTSAITLGNQASDTPENLQYSGGNFQLMFITTSSNETLQLKMSVSQDATLTSGSVIILKVG